MKPEHAQAMLETMRVRRLRVAHAVYPDDLEHPWIVAWIESGAVVRKNPRATLPAPDFTLLGRVLLLLPRGTPGQNTDTSAQVKGAR